MTRLTMTRCLLAILGVPLASIATGSTAAAESAVLYQSGDLCVKVDYTIHTPTRNGFAADPTYYAEGRTLSFHGDCSTVVATSGATLSVRVIYWSAHPGDSATADAASSGVIVGDTGMHYQGDLSWPTGPWRKVQFGDADGPSRGVGYYKVVIDGRANGQGGRFESQWSFYGDVPDFADYRNENGQFSGGGGCFYYEDREFDNDRGQLAPGYWQSNIGGFDNQIESIRVPQGYVAVGWDYPDFQGPATVYRSDSPFVGDRWNGRISSFACVPAVR